MVIRLTVVAMVCTLAVVASAAKLHSDDEFIDLINSKQTSWKAGRNFHPNMPKKDIKKFTGDMTSFKKNSPKSIKHKTELVSDHMDRFDPREKWPNCPSLNEIRDQGSCASDWAIAAVSAMTDRICIYSEGKTQIRLSAEDLLSCCVSPYGECGDCQRGQSRKAWEYWQKYGIVSGGNYNSNQGCKPYSIPTCEHKLNNSESTTVEKTICTDFQEAEKPNCFRKCTNNYTVPYKMDKQYGDTVYKISHKEEAIKADLFNRGPVEAEFLVYSDFYHYKSGVYEHVEGEYLHSQYVKLMGWGVENGIKYWLAANSWNTYWGEKGFFKIVRGKDHLGIESYIIAGEPRHH